MPDIPNEWTGNDKLEELHYPLFATSEVHSNYVDWYALFLPFTSGARALADTFASIKFFGDLILSRACGGPSGKPSTSSEHFKRNDILLWKIDGFPSSAEYVHSTRH